MKTTLICGVLWLASLSLAEARTLYWPSLDVHVRVDAEGALHITERHAMMFDGDWSGGERTFHLRSWHRLRLESVTEIVPDSGARTELVEGDLDAVNEYRLNDGHVLRWRSRLPTDPPFRNTLRVYEIAYSLRGTLLPEGDAYALNHDLAFPDRSGAIERFDAVIEIAPEWAAPNLPLAFQREHLPPGQGVHVTGLLQYQGSGRPSAVAAARIVGSATSFPVLRYGAVAIVVAFAVFSALEWRRSEKALGRFEPTIPLDRIDEQWLAEHVFSLKPEVVGATWDRNTSAAEVAALIARLTLEGKLASSVRPEGWGPFRSDSLHLTLLCGRDEFNAYERRLIDRLFFDDSNETDTAAIRAHYKEKGFNPAHEIDAMLRKHAPSVFGSRFSLPAWRGWFTATLLLLGAILLVVSWIRAPDTTPSSLLPLIAFVVLYAIGMVLAYVYSANVHELRPRVIRALIAPALICIGLALVLPAGVSALTLLQLVALPLIALALLNSLFSRMYSRDMPRGMQLRRTLGSARRYFERELASANPRLKDEWLPYLLAFGLGPDVDRWFTAFGGAGRGGRSNAGSPPSHSPGPGGSPTWTGGGGTFGGGGASGSWGAAVAGVAAGVSAPSPDGGSGSTGGGGGSSGGGGGGGW